MILQDILNTFTCTLFLLESYTPYNEIKRNCTRIYGLFFFSLDMYYFNLKPDMILHHSLASTMFITSYMYPFSDENVYRIIGNTEWSTFVLTILNYINKPYQLPFQLLFSTLFFKFRIYDLYCMFQTHTFTTIQITPLLSIYALNLYWFVLICKKMCSLLKHSNLITQNHFMISYTTFMNNLILTICSFSNYTYLCLIHSLNLIYMYKYTIYDINFISMPSFAVDIIYHLWLNPTIELFTITLLILYIHVLHPFYDLSFVGTHIAVLWYSGVILKF
jgi:hypothetical protein